MLKRLLPGVVVAVALLGLAGPAVAQPSPPPRPAPVGPAQSGNGASAASSNPAPGPAAPATHTPQSSVPATSSAPAPQNTAAPQPQPRVREQESAPTQAQRQSAGAVANSPAGPVTLPYTGSGRLPGGDYSPAAPFSNTPLATLRFHAPMQVGHKWPGQGVLSAGDVTGNGHADILLFKNEGGSVKILLYEGLGNGRVVRRNYVGHGWNSFDYITLGDLDGDGKADIIGRKSDGTLWYYRSGGVWGFHEGIQIGHKWQVMRSITMLPATSRSLPVVMATDNSGRLYTYPFVNRSGVFGNRIVHGTGWNKITRIMPAGDWDNNGRADFYATDSSGVLYMYLASGDGRAFPSYKIGHGWNIMNQVMAVPAANLAPGIYGINDSGYLMYYPLQYVSPRPPRPAYPNWGNWVAPRNNIKLMTWSVVPQRYWNGTKVRVVRLALGRGAPLDASMTFDAGTEYAVKRFQRRAGLYPSGVVDMNTWNRLTNRSWWMDNWEYPPLVNQWASHDQRVEALIRGAQSFIGTPYTWGGAGPGIDGADCSGMVLQAMYAAGIDPQPIQAVNDAHPTYRLSKALYAYPHLWHVPFGQRQRGDLIFWSGRYGIYHVAVYVGGNQVIESNYGFARQRPLYNWDRITPDVVRPVVY